LDKSLALAAYTLGCKWVPKSLPPPFERGLFSASVLQRGSTPSPHLHKTTS